MPPTGSPCSEWPRRARSGASIPSVTLVVARDCHLCERARNELGALSAEGRTGVDQAGFARLADGTDLRAPTLLLHSTQDAVAPFATARRLAELRPDLVSLHPVAGAAHAALWNADPRGYEETLRRFLTPIL